MMDSDFRNGIRLLSSRAVLKRFEAVRILQRKMVGGCPLSRLALEYALEHDPNSAVRNRISLVFKRSSFSSRENCWETHFAF